ncbi:MAG: hypothetical protein ACE5GJ_14355, partial [Gemmatimonadota bacterium]
VVVPTMSTRKTPACGPLHYPDRLLAFALSLVFNGVILGLWFTRFGNPYSHLGTGPGGITLGDAVAGPSTGASALRVGDAALLDALSPDDLADVAGRAQRMERHISEERKRKKTRRANVLLLVRAQEASQAQSAVESIVEEYAARWKLAEISSTEEGGHLLIYLARMDDPGVEGAVMDQLANLAASETPPLSAAELRPLRGLHPRA